MFTRRMFLERTGLTGGALALAAPSGREAFAADGAHGLPQPPGALRGGAAERLYATIATYPLDDTHCHPISEKDAQTTPKAFLQRIALAAFPAAAYFPTGVFRKWERGDEATRADLDKQYGIQQTLDRILNHFSSAVFVKYMIKEMAGFLGCKPTLEEVIEARNARGREYGKYMNALFQDVRLENVMIDTGFTDGLDAKGIQHFEETVLPTRARYLARVDTIQGPILREAGTFAEVRDRFLAQVRDALDGTGNNGRKSYGMKSYLLPRIGVIKPVYDERLAAASWDEAKGKWQTSSGDRFEDAQRGKVLLEYLLTLAIEECLTRDMPMQFHAGDGEAPGVILRNQQPYYLEEIVRFDKDGVMRMPKIIPIHAGYPLVSEAAWLSHLYTNCYFELSLMTPFIHQGLVHRYLEIMEAVPLSKILFGSDAYNVPELYWLAGRWGKRFLSQALAVYVDQQVLTEDEALEAARMILYKNNRATYNLAS
jgi:predicted TIM-barrel fold metal-dependent hydrolase